MVYLVFGTGVENLVNMTIIPKIPFCCYFYMFIYIYNDICKRFLDFTLFTRDVRNELLIVL